MAKTRYQLTFRPVKYLLTLSQNTIGRQPKIESEHVSGVSFSFDPPLTAQEKQDLLNAVPQYFKDLFEIEVV